MEGGDLAKLLSALTSICSVSQNDRKNAEKWLRDLEKSNPAYLSQILIQLIAKSRPEPIPEAIVAALHLKHVVSRNFINPPVAGGERRSTLESITTATIELIAGEQRNTVAVQLAALVSETAVVEALRQAPENWNTLHSITNQLVNLATQCEDIAKASPEDVDSRRTATILLATRRLLCPLQMSVKTLCVADALTGVQQKYFWGEFVPKLFDIASSKWAFAVGIMMLTINYTDEDDVPYLEALAEICLMAIKILRRMGIGMITGQVGFADCYNHTADSVIQNLPDVVITMLEFRGSLKPDSIIKVQSRLVKFIDRHIITAGKLVIDLLMYQGEFFAKYLKEYVELYANQFVVAPPVADIPRWPKFEAKFTIQCMRFLITSMESSQDPIQEAVNAIFNGESYTCLMRKVVSSYLVVTRAEMQMWDEDPFQLLRDDFSDDFYRIKPVAQYLFLALVRAQPDENPALAIKCLQEFLVDAEEKNVTSDTEYSRVLVQKEACYRAISQCYNQFHNLIPFASFFRSKILPDLRVHGQVNPFTRIIRRQVAILLTEDWRCDAVKEQPTDVYDVLLMLVTSDDPVVAVWGAIALGQVISDGVVYQAFQPYTEPFAKGLMLLAYNVRHEMVATRVLDVIGDICAELEEHMEVFSVNVVKLLGELWENSNQMIQCAVLRCLVRLVEALGANKISIILPSIMRFLDKSTDITVDKDQSFTRDALILWLTVLENTLDCDERLLKLLPALSKILEHCPSDHVAPSTLFAVCHAYLLVAFDDFLQVCSGTFFSAVVNMLSDKASKESWHSEALDAVVLILQTMFLRDYGTAQSPSKNGRNGLRMLTVGEEKHSPQSQEISTQLVPVLQVILSNFASPDDNIPRSYIIPQYAACIARFVVCQRSLFGSVLRSCDDWVAALARIIAPWLDNVCLEEKMHTEVAPAPSALRLTIKNMSVYNQFIILLTSQVLASVVAAAEGTSQKYGGKRIIISPSALINVKHHAIWANDIINHDLKDFACQKAQEAYSTYGEEFTRALGGFDGIVEQLKIRTAEPKTVIRMR